MRRQSGFTTVELIAAIILLVLLSSLYLTREQSLAAANRDTERKTAINAMYYSLEEVYFPEAKSYPLKLDKTTLKSVDPELLKDPDGRAIGEPKSDYRYEPSGCNATVCSGYTLRADLEKEPDFIKQNR